MAMIFAVLWVDPVALGRSVPGDLFPILMFEFLVLHSTAFLVGFRVLKGFPMWGSWSATLGSSPCSS